MLAALLVSFLGLGRAQLPKELSDAGIGCYDQKDKGQAYRGLLSFAASGRACQNWLTQHPHKISFVPSPDNGLGNHNYCRNPDGSEAKPWCYTADPTPDHAKEACNVPVCATKSRDFAAEAKFLAAGLMDAHVDLGIASIDKGGASLKPQFKLGIGTDRASAEVGIGDVRDGLKVAAQAEVFEEASAVGRNLHELHDHIHSEFSGFDEALRVAKQLLENSAQEPTEVIKQIASALGQDPETIEHVLAGKYNPTGDAMKLRVLFSLAAGVSAEVRLGWCDTAGYHMIGAGGHAAMGEALGASVFVGKHSSGSSMKLVLVISNFSFEYTLPTA